MKTKEISWSYPTSPNAVQYGFSKTGCWTVSLESDGDILARPFSHTIKGFLSLPEARAFCAEREELYSKYSL